MAHATHARRFGVLDAMHGSLDRRQHFDDVEDGTNRSVADGMDLDRDPGCRCASCELGELGSTREGRCRGLSPSWLGTYDRVLGNRGVPAVVQVVEQYCQGCQMHITIHDVTRAWKGAEVVQCRSCGRILYAATL